MAAERNKRKQNEALRQVAIDRLLDIYTVAQNALTDSTYHSALKIRYKKLEEIYSEFNSRQNYILQGLALDDTADMETERNIGIQVDSKYFAIQEAYYELFEKGSESVAPLVPTPNQNTNITLPKLNVPLFSGDLKLWPTFIDLFKSLIHNNTTISNIEKFRYLQSFLSGEALTLIKNIKVTESNYDIAFDKLVKTFQNERALATFYWEEIYSFPKLHSESSKQLKQILSVFSDNLEALQNLNLPVAQWDFLLFHTLSKKIDSETLYRFEQKYA